LLEEQSLTRPAEGKGSKLPQGRRGEEPRPFGKRLACKNLDHFAVLAEIGIVIRGRMSTTGGVVAVTSLALEARVALGPGVSVICNQGVELIAALEAAIKRGVAGIISFGIAGGLAPDLAAGDWIVGTAVRAGQDLFPTDQIWARRLLKALPSAVHAEIAGLDAPIPSRLEKRRLHAETGAVAVDTESHIAARIARAHGIPFAACRAVIDAADRDLPPAAMVGLHQDGTPDVLAVFRSVVRQPGQLPVLLRTALDARIARDALRRGRPLLGAGLGFPHFSNVATDMARPGRGEPILPSPKMGFGR
jgi:adenosylhomocysteine nucleosidase